MTITPSDGDYNGPIKCLYTQQEGPVTSRMTLAMGKPGADAAPENYDLAMTSEGGLMELYLVKCGGGESPPGEEEAGGASSCDFSASAPQ